MTTWRPRLVAIDLDGTLLDTTGAVPPANVAALQALPVPYVIVTGRPWRWMAPVLEHLPAEGSAILANGALVVDLATGDVLLSRLLAADDALICANALRLAVPDCGFAVEYADVTPYGYETEYRPRYLVEGARNAPIAELLDRPIAKLLCRSASHDADALHEVAHAALQGQPLTLTHSSGSDGLLEISAAGADKGSALAAYAAELGVDRADVIAFGDVLNDLPMLIWAGRGVAVANAHPHTRAAADAVTGAHDADGVAEELARWFPELSSR
jgi:Cof subfamily protein (haloacid dehalogenase superfamily)